MTNLKTMKPEWKDRYNRANDGAGELWQKMDAIIDGDTYDLDELDELQRAAMILGGIASAIYNNPESWLDMEAAKQAAEAQGVTEWLDDSYRAERDTLEDALGIGLQ